jgi:hypothetical protein
LHNQLRRLADEQKFVRYCALHFASTLGLTLLVGGVGELVAGVFASSPESVPRRNVSTTEPLFLFSIVIFAPLVETVVYRWLLIFLVARARPQVALPTAAIVAGALHGPYPITFIAVTGSFLMYALAWHHWREVSSRKSFWAPAISHSSVNGALYAISSVA